MKTNNQVVKDYFNGIESEGLHIYSCGKTLYSYGCHYVAVTKANNKRNEELYIINSYKYSNTTTKHLCIVKNYVPNNYVEILNAISLSTFCGKYVFDKRVIDTLIYESENILEFMLKLKRARSERSIKYYSRYIEYSKNNLKTYIKFFDLDKRQKFANGKIANVVKLAIKKNEKVRTILENL